MFNLHKRRIQINNKLLHQLSFKLSQNVKDMKSSIQVSLEPKKITKKKYNLKIITNQIEKLEMIYFFYMILGITVGSFIYYVKL